MPSATRQGESAGIRRHAFPGHRILCRIGSACALLAALLWLPPAHAGALYRCTGSGGETVFSSTSAGYSGCRRLGSYDAAVGRASARRMHAVPSREAAPPRPVAALANISASVQSTARLVSLADTQATVGTTAKLPKPGQWRYRDGTAGSVAADGREPAERVLRGAVYRVVHGDGSVEYTNLKPSGQPGRAVTMLFSYIATCMACNLHSPIDWNHVGLNFTAYADAIRAASSEFGVSEAFLRAVIHAESAYNPHALSLKGAQGLMQLMPETAGEMGVLDAFDADQNIRGGARYLALLLKDFGGNEQLAAAAYNAGPAAVQRYNGVPPYAETQVYVQRVGELRRRYGAAAHAPVTAMRGAAGGF